MLKSHRTVSSFALSFITALIMVCAGGRGMAQSPQVFVSAHGSDGGNCTSAQPCRTVNFALVQVQVGGQVLIVDSGDYDSSITVTKNVTIAAAPGVAAVFSPAVTNGTIFLFNYPASFCSAAGECHILILRNLIFDGQGVTQDAIRPAGIRLLAEDCTFTRFRFGVFVNGGGAYQFKNCIFESMETGISLAPSTDGTVVRSQTVAVVEDSRFAAMTSAGIDVFTGPIGQNTLRAAVRDSFFNRSAVGVRSNASTGGSIQVDLERCEIANGTTGVASAFAGSTVRVSNSTIVGNGTGLSVASAGQLFTRGNNTVEGNTTNGLFTGTFFAK